MSYFNRKCPIISVLDPEQQAKIQVMWNALHLRPTEGEPVSGYGGSYIKHPVYQTLLDKEPSVAAAAQLIFSDFEDTLTNAFVGKIFARGLFAAVEDAQFRCMGVDVGSVSIRTLDTMGRLLITLSRGQDDQSPDYRMVSFLTTPNTPAQLQVISFCGCRDELLTLIEDASVPFKDFPAGYTAMRPSNALFAGIPVGEKKNQRPEVK